MVALKGDLFAAEFGFAADFEIKSTDATPDMEEAYAGSIGTHSNWGLTDDGEHVVLFSWDGASDLVADRDMVNLGTPSDTNDIGDKTGDGGGPITWARVTDLFDPVRFDLPGVSWTCAPAPGSGPLTGCPASGGAGELAAGVPVSLEAGDSVLFSVAAPILLTATGSLVNTASIAPPAGIPDTDPSGNAATDTDSLLPLGACGAPHDRHLTGTVDGARLFRACRTITAGELAVVLPGGDLTLRAGEAIVLGEGFAVETDCQLQLELDPSLASG